MCRNNESHTHDCHEVFPNYNWTNSIAVAYHLAWAVNYIHQHGYIVGDMNSNNIMIHSDGSITILDVDSFDITDPDTGERFECTVGISEFLAPELQGRDLRKAKFTKHTDEFALAVHIFQLLMGNAHPFNVKVVDSVKQSLPENKLEMNIVNGNCPWVKAIDGITTPPGAPYLTMLPAKMQTAFKQVFGYNATNAAAVSSRRISADMWRQLLYMFYQRAVMQGGRSDPVPGQSGAFLPEGPGLRVLQGKTALRAVHSAADRRPGKEQRGPGPRETQVIQAI